MSRSTQLNLVEICVIGSRKKKTERSNPPTRDAKRNKIHTQTFDATSALKTLGKQQEHWILKTMVSEIHSRTSPQSPRAHKRARNPSFACNYRVMARSHEAHPQSLKQGCAKKLSKSKQLMVKIKPSSPQVYRCPSAEALSQCPQLHGGVEDLKSRQPTSPRILSEQSPRLWYHICDSSSP